MPSSRPELIPVVVNLVMELQPRSILEIGTGFGKYGFLFREYLDIWGAAADPSRLARSGWRVRIDGIECHAPYISDLQRQIYDAIIIGDAQVEIDRLGMYDLIFLGDVIEHFPKSAGRQLLDKCVAHAERAVIVTTPNYFHAQGPEYGNERETHHCLWTAEDFASYPGAQCHVVAGRYNLAVVPAVVRTGMAASPVADRRSGIPPAVSIAEPCT